MLDEDYIYKDDKEEIKEVQKIKDELKLKDYIWGCKIA